MDTVNIVKFIQLRLHATSQTVVNLLASAEWSACPFSDPTFVFFVFPCPCLVHRVMIWCDSYEWWLVIIQTQNLCYLNWDRRLLADHELEMFTKCTCGLLHSNCYPNISIKEWNTVTRNFQQESCCPAPWSNLVPHCDIACA